MLQSLFSKFRWIQDRKIFYGILGLVWGLGIWSLNGCASSAKPHAVLQVGNQAPNFDLVDSNGHRFDLYDVKKHWGVILIFYRGSWCEACEDQLLNLKYAYPKFLKLHFTLAAISTDSIATSYTFNHECQFPFPLLCDSRLRIIDQYGLRDPHPNNGKFISLPATVILEPNHKIYFKYVGKNPLDLPTVNEIINVLKEIRKTES